MHRILLVLTGIVFIFSSCRYRHEQHHRKGGGSRSEQRNISGFTGVETHSSIDVVITQGPYNIKVDADGDVLDDIKTSVENGHLIIRFTDHHSLFDDDEGDATVYVTAPDLNLFEAHSSGNITGSGKISNNNNIDIKASASGDIELQLDCPTVKAETNGSGNITIKGESKTVTAQVSGSGDISADNLKAETVKASVHGSGDIEVFASESLDAEIFGSGNVEYKGNPRINSAIHGSGEVSKRD